MSPAIQDDVAPVEDELLEDVNEDEILEDDDTDDLEVTTTVKRKRKTFSEDNVYVYPPTDEGKAAANKAKGELTYTDKTLVTGLRVFTVHEGVKLDDNGNVTDEGTLKHYVVGRSKQYACESLCDKLDLTISLANRRAGRGRQATKVEANMLMFGKLLQQLGPDNLDAAQKAQWVQFEAGGKFAHYRDADGNWKEATA